MVFLYTLIKYTYKMASNSINDTMYQIPRLLLSIENNYVLYMFAHPEGSAYSHLIKKKMLKMRHFEMMRQLKRYENWKSNGKNEERKINNKKKIHYKCFSPSQYMYIFCVHKNEAMVEVNIIWIFFDFRTLFDLEYYTYTLSCGKLN